MATLLNGTTNIDEQIASMPKVELHRHLEGSVRFLTLLELAKKYDRVPKEIVVHEDQQKCLNDPKIRDAFLLERPCGSLTLFLQKFSLTQSLLCSYEIIERVTFESIEDCALEGVKILELRYSPFFIRMGHEFMTYDCIHAAILRGIARASLTYPSIVVGLIGIIDRNISFEEAKKVADFIIQNKDTFIAIDLANDESYDAKVFIPLFAEAKRNGLHVTIHAGEVPSPDASTRIKEAIDLLGAERIGHGVQAQFDQQIQQYIKQKSIVLEVCPTSNWVTSAVPQIDEHPIKNFFDSGMLVTISSDDPGIFGISLTNEYHLAIKKLGLSLEDLRTANQIAAKYSFLPEEVKVKYWDFS